MTKTESPDGMLYKRKGHAYPQKGTQWPMWVPCGELPSVTTAHAEYVILAEDNDMQCIIPAEMCDRGGDRLPHSAIELTRDKRNRVVKVCYWNNRTGKKITIRYDTKHCVIERRES